MTSFIDSHAHLAFDDFQTELDAAVKRAQLAGVRRIVSVGTDADSSRKNIEIARRFKGVVFAVAGWHPNDAEEAPKDIRGFLREMSRCEEVVALGETGLDYFRLPTSSDPGRAESMKIKQKEIFRQHLEVAGETGMNVVIHQRSAMDDTLEIFQEYADKVQAVFHCFVDGPEVLKKVLELNGLVSFTGIITFKTAEEARLSVEAVADDRYMVETDSPFLAPVPYRGKRCEPAFVLNTAQKVAEVRNQSLSAVAANTSSTAERFFRGLL